MSTKTTENGNPEVDDNKNEKKYCNYCIFNETFEEREITPREVKRLEENKEREFYETNFGRREPEVTEEMIKEIKENQKKELEESVVSTVVSVAKIMNTFFG